MNRTGFGFGSRRGCGYVYLVFVLTEVMSGTEESITVKVNRSTNPVFVTSKRSVKRKRV